MMYHKHSPVRDRALDRILYVILALVLCLEFLSLPTGVLAADGLSDDLKLGMTPDISLTGYVFRMLIALGILAGLGYLLVKYLPKRFKLQNQDRVRLIGALNLGRDVVYLLSVGPDVVAVLASKSGSILLGRWSREEWDDDEIVSQIKAGQES